MKKLFQFYSPTKIVAGKDALSHLPFELQQLGGSRPLILTDKTLSKIGLVDKLKKVLDKNKMMYAALYDDVPADSDILVVNKIAKIFRERNCNSIIALGGGSVLDTAKGVNITVTEDADNILDLAGAHRLSKQQYPFIAIPTTSGTGSEVTLAAVIADKEKNEKLEFLSDLVIPQVAILDPAFTLTLPRSLTVTTAFDALVHAIEAMTCKQKNPFSHGYGAQAISMIKDNLHPCLKEPRSEKYRLNLAVASTMAGVAFSNSMVGLVHAIGHSLGAVAHIPHGQAMMLLLTACMEYNGQFMPHLYDDILLHFTDPTTYALAEKPSQKAIELIRKFQLDLCRQYQLPVTLEEAGVKKGLLRDIAENAMYDPAILLNPVEIEEHEVLKILEKLYA